jgi:hypothetical protein
MCCLRILLRCLVILRRRRDRVCPRDLLWRSRRHERPQDSHNGHHCKQAVIISAQRHTCTKALHRAEYLQGLKRADTLSARERAGYEW